MSPARILAYLAEQTQPLTEDQITAHFGLTITAAALCESTLLRMLDDGKLCEPLGEFKGFSITDAGREALAEMSKTVARKPAQMSMF